jgi:glucose/arabinose dehydrogenase
MTPEQGASALHPFAPHMTGRASKDLPVDKLKVPAGFKVEVWADGIPEARSLALGDKGTVFVSNRLAKNVYAVVDKGGTREVKTLLTGLNAPNGIVFSKGTLYVAERDKITRYDGIEGNLDSPPAPKVVIDGLDPQTQPGHFWKFLAMGPDGKLYYNVGAPGNIVMPSYFQAAIWRVDPKTGISDEYVRGVRNSVGFDWNPQTKQLWFTNHGRDWVNDDMPNDTLHRASRKGMDFGYPYCHQGDFLDPEFGKGRSCKDFDPPAAKLGAHIAPLGMRFYTGKMFPAEYRNNIFIAMHGSWNRSTKQGYNITRVIVDASGKVTKMEPFLTGFLQDEKADPPMWGRPVDVLQLKDGSLLFSDDYNGILYRVSYNK